MTTGRSTHSDEIAAAKATLRRSMQERLRAIDEVDWRRASREACDRLLELDEVRDAGTILFYMAMRAEMDPSKAMRWCLEEGMTVAVPRIDPETRELEAIQIESLDERFFLRDRMGIPVPRDGRLVRATELDTIVAPGLAFDRNRRRLGRGAGYYDRLLVRVREHCSIVGFLHHAQLVDEVPTADHDRPVGRIVTDRETI